MDKGSAPAAIDTMIEEVRTNHKGAFSYPWDQPANPSFVIAFKWDWRRDASSVPTSLVILISSNYEDHLAEIDTLVARQMSSEV